MGILSRRIAIQRPERETPLARRRRHCRLVREFARELNLEIRRALSLVSRLAAALSFAREGWRPALVKATALSRYL